MRSQNGIAVAGVWQACGLSVVLNENNVANEPVIIDI